MPKLPVLSGKDVVRFLHKQGFAFAGQHGSHVKMRDANGNTAIIPMHRTLATGTLLEILEKARVSREDLINFFIRKRGR